MVIKKIKEKGLRNTRDLGQLSTITNVKIKPKMLIRSGRLDKMSEKNRNQFLEDYNVRLIIDLRTDVEIYEEKSFVYPQNIKYVHVPILNKSFFGITHEKKMSKALSKDCKNWVDQVKEDAYLVEMYKAIVFSEESQKMLEQVLEMISSVEDGAILYHCNSGKDRTGLLTMLLLYILGVDEKTILDDYEATAYFNRFYIRSRMFLLRIAFFIKRAFRNLLKNMLKAKREYMAKTMDAINEKYESIDNYVVNILHFDYEKWEILRNRFLEK